MRDSITHRGPDDAGTWVSPSGHALIGSRRLAILDLSPSGHQPMEAEESGLVIAFNGEIYNYRELAEDLAKAGCRFRSRSDTEVLLKSYEIWGSECLSRLNGMFAFAIWDERRQELFAARDRFGEKPFYFYHDSNRELFAFGSEIKALNAGRFFSPRSCQSAVYGFLVNREIDSGLETLFENVFALPAAHALRFSLADRSLKIWRYWDLDPEREIRLPDDKQYAERFLELLADSVRIRLRSDVPVGSSLSGGLDSSTIVGLIAENGQTNGQETFSARFHDNKFDEGTYIERMTNWANVKSHFIYPDPARVPEEFGLLTYYQDNPSYSVSTYAQWCVMRLAKEHDVTVLLDGQGADEILAGYHGYFSSYYKHLIRQFELSKALSSIACYIQEHGRGCLPLILSDFLPKAVRRGAHGWLRPRAIREEFRQKWARPPMPINRKYRDDLQQSLYATLTQTSLPNLLRHADRNAMAFSREVRLPFLDHRLVEFVFATPADQKIRGTSTKVMLRNAIGGIVPEEIRNRQDKVGYAAPEVAWLRGPLRSWIQEVFSSREFRQREWWEPAVVNRVWKRFQEGEGGLYSSIWRWLSLEVWARTCLVPKVDRKGDSALLASTTGR
jgi:asparagine synthase (glutamine-hydrolysing)